MAALTGTAPYRVRRCQVSTISTGRPICGANITLTSFVCALAHWPVIATCSKSADDKFGELQRLIEPKAGLALLGRMIGNFDLSAYPLDGPLPELPQTQDGQRSRQQLLIDLAQGESLTIRQLYERIAGGRGHFTVVGTAQTVADQMHASFEQEAADGFNFMAPALPGGLDDFLSLVVPELQRRGLFRAAYQGTTLRAHLGLMPERVRVTRRAD